MNTTLTTLRQWSDAGWLRRLDSALAAFVLELDPQAPPALLDDTEMPADWLLISLVFLMSLTISRSVLSRFLSADASLAITAPCSVVVLPTLMS